MNHFQDWVAAVGGPEKAASKIGVKTCTIQFWMYRRGSPSVVNLMKLIKASRGALTFETILGSTRRKAVGDV